LVVKMRPELSDAIAYFKHKVESKAKIGIILGSGLGSFADELSDAVSFAAEQIPHFPSSTVEGHTGEFVFGSMEHIPIIVIKGRTHFYEGYQAASVTYVIRILKALGIKIVIITNAAGGINSKFRAGDLMLIDDHINFMFQNPLRGDIEPAESRFIDMTNPYAHNLYPVIKQIALNQGIVLHQGILLASTGPSYETSSEVKMISSFKADAVSMSTIPEVIVARQLNLEVIGISCITNMATGIENEPLSHNDVTRTAALIQNKFNKLLKGIIKAIYKFL